MPGITLSTANDRVYSGSTLWCDFRTGTIPARFCNQIVLTSGNAPSYATFGVPVAEFGPTKYDRVAREVAFAALGPMKYIKFRAMARCGINVDGYEQTKLVGWYVARTHNVGPLTDDIAGQVYDARWRLSKVTTKYRLTWDPSTNHVYWDPVPLRFNDFGYPNCVDHPALGPLFAPCHRFGYSNSSVKDDITEPEVGKASARSRSWRGRDAIKYLQTCHAANKQCPLPVVDWGRDRLPPEIIWPDDLGNIPGNDRTLKDVGEHGESLLDALCDVLRRMGAYDLGSEPGAEWNTRLCVYDMKPSASGSQRIFLPDYFGALTPGQLVRDSTVLHDASVTESIINYSDDVAILGDTPKIEMFCSSLSTPLGEPNMDLGCGLLEPAWADTDETGYKDYVTAHGDSTDAEAVAKKRYPLVYAAWKIPLGANFWAGTKWDGFLNKNRIRISPNQVTGYNMSDSNPRNWQPREQVVEVLLYPEEEDPDGTGPWPEPSWNYAVSYDNLTLSADSIIVMMSAVRDDSNPDRRSYVQYRRDAPNNGYGANLHARKVRVNLAVLADWPIIGRAGTGGQAADDPNFTQATIDQADKYTWQVVSEPMDYIEDLRLDDSRPIGNRSGANVVAASLLDEFAPRKAAGDELFSDRPGPAANPETTTTRARLPRHAIIRLAETKMIEVTGSGRIACHAPCWRPGLPVEIVGSNTIANYSVLKTVTFNAPSPVPDDIGEHTVLHFGRPDTGIWDAPSGGARAATSAQNAGYESGGGGGSGGAGVTSGTDAQGNVSGGGGAKTSTPQTMATEQAQAGGGGGGKAAQVAAAAAANRESRGAPPAGAAAQDARPWNAGNPVSTGDKYPNKGGREGGGSAQPMGAAAQDARPWNAGNPVSTGDKYPNKGGREGGGVARPMPAAGKGQRAGAGKQVGRVGPAAQQPRGPGVIRTGDDMSNVDASKFAPRESNVDASKFAPRESNVDASKFAPREGPQDIGRYAPREGPDASKYAPRSAARIKRDLEAGNAARKAAREAARPAPEAKRVPQRINKYAAEQEE